MIIERNFRWKGGEIDLIARDADCLVFVEVRSAAAASPWLRSSIGPLKRRRLVAGAEIYVARRREAGRLARRFDIVWVEGAAFDHWKNVLL